eukprot:6452752-Amphidinium_carterae.2
MASLVCIQGQGQRTMVIQQMNSFGMWSSPSEVVDKNKTNQEERHGYTRRTFQGPGKIILKDKGSFDAFMHGRLCGALCCCGVL